MRRNGRHFSATSLAVAIPLVAVCACSGDDFGPPPCRVNRGGVYISVPVAPCPKLGPWGILPREVNVGASVQLVASAIGASADVVQYTWSADGGGTVADPHAAITTFQCTAPGEFTIEISVSNSEAAMGTCQDVATGSVQCDPNDGGAAADGQ
jgi:hypothetical protein